MHVINVAVNDLEFESETFSAALADASPEAAANLCQVVAVGGLCNSAIIGGGKEGEGKSGRSIMGNETGNARDQWPFRAFRSQHPRCRCHAVLGRRNVCGLLTRPMDGDIQAQLQFEGEAARRVPHLKRY